jgi:hypothetical protein
MRNEREREEERRERERQVHPSQRHRQRFVLFCSVSPVARDGGQNLDSSVMSIKEYYR